MEPLCIKDQIAHIIKIINLEKVYAIQILPDFKKLSLKLEQETKIHGKHTKILTMNTKIVLY